MRKNKKLDTAAGAAFYKYYDLEENRNSIIPQVTHKDIFISGYVAAAKFYEKRSEKSRKIINRNGKILHI